MIQLPAENKIHEQKLFELIASGEAILLVGAGSSKIVGYPLWTELIDLLEIEVKNFIEDNGGSFKFRAIGSDENELEYSARLKDALGEARYGALMHHIFDNKECDECHIKLMELPFRGILTTNYDRTLEDALFKINNRPDNSLVIDESITNREINKFFQALNYGFTGDRKITHLHGIYKQAASLVLCINDYAAKYSPEDSRWTLHKRIIWALMATRRIIYLGFSMTDPFFQMMHSIASDDLGNFGTDTHFMISRFSTDDDKEEHIPGQLKFAERVKRNYGIQTVFYEDDTSYKGLKMYLSKMNHEIGQLHRSKLLKESNTEEELNEAAPSDSSINDKLKLNLQKRIDGLKGK